MGQLEDMAMFVRIVEAGSISRAADQLGIAKSAVSRRLNELEKRLNCQLLSRTTRKSHLTSAGERYFLQAKGLLEQVAELNDLTQSDNTQIEGTIKLTAPLSFGLLHLGRLIDDFAQQHPGLSFELDFSDRHVDLVEEGVEMAIRIGELRDSSLQAKRLTRIDHALCASPGYLTRHGQPTIPSDLHQHTLLQYGNAPTMSLQMTGPDGQRHDLNMHSRIKANNGDFLKKMAMNDHGICLLPTFLVYSELASQQLVSLLPDYQLPVVNAYAVYPRNRFLSQRCRLLIEFIAQELGDPPYWQVKDER